MKKIFMVALLLVTMVFAGCGGGDTAKPEEPKITIGLDDEYAPMGFKNEQNEIIGFSRIQGYRLELQRGGTQKRTH